MQFVRTRFYCLLIMLCSALVPMLTAQSIHYSYDELGRLVGVVDQNGNAAQYAYDANGNMLSIARYTSSQVAVLGFSPTSGGAGTTVTISGAQFGTTASQNTVSFNGVSASVVSATGNQIVAIVPAGATTGPISVKAPLGSASSNRSFTILTGAAEPPSITGFTPNVATAGSTVTLTGANFAVPSASNLVSVQNRSASISATGGSSTSVPFMVPSSAGSGPVTLQTIAGLTVSSSDLFIAPAPYSASQVVQSQRVATGVPVTVALPQTGTISMFTFSGKVGQNASVQLNNSTFAGSACNPVLVSILNPDGSLLIASNECFIGSTLFLGPVTLPTTGLYTIVVSAQNGGTGSASLLLSLFSNITGQVTPGTQASVSIKIPGQAALYSFNATAGQIASVSLSNSTFSGSYCNPVIVSILSPTGSQLASSNACGFGATLFMGPVVLPTTGTYTAVVAPQNGATGNTNLLLSVFSNLDTSTTSGTAVTININEPGQAADLTFSGTAGQMASVQLSNSTLPGCSAATLSVLNPNGSVLASTNNICSASALLSQVTLPTTGIYNVVITPSNGGTGSVTVLLSLFQNISGAIASGSVLKVNINTPGQIAQYTFSGTAGQFASVQISNSTFSSGETISILNPDGSTLTSANNFWGNSSFFVSSVALPTTGNYKLVISPNGGGTGSATVLLSLFQNISGSVVSGSGLSVSINTPGQIAQYTFSGTGGQFASVQISNSTFSSGETISILNPDGSTLTSANNFWGNSSFFVSSVALPTTGNYKLVISPNGGGTGSATVTLYAFHNISGTITSSTPLTVNITTPGQVANLTISGTAGQQVSVQLSNSNFSSQNCVSAQIFSPSGSQLNFASTCGQSLFLNQITLPTTGTYTLQIGSTSGGTGSASVTLYVFQNLVAAPPSGSPTTVNITTPGQVANLTFSGNAGQSVSVLLNNSTFSSQNCVSAQILSVSGAQLNYGSTCGQSLFLNPLTLPTTGTYTLQIGTTNGGTGSASVTFYILQNMSGTITSGAAQTVNITTPGQVANLTFIGASGKQVSVQLSNSTFSSQGCVSAQILNPSGAQLNYGSTCGQSFSLNSLTLSTAGTYTLQVGSPK